MWCTRTMKPKSAKNADGRSYELSEVSQQFKHVVVGQLVTVLSVDGGETGTFIQRPRCIFEQSPAGKERWESLKPRSVSSRSLDKDLLMFLSGFFPLVWYPVTPLFSFQTPWVLSFSTIHWRVIHSPVPKREKQTYETPYSLLCLGINAMFFLFFKNFTSLFHLISTFCTLFFQSDALFSRCCLHIVKFL